MITAPISPGELLDKISILQIKRERIRDQTAARHILLELELLERTRDHAIHPSEELSALLVELANANRTLWDIEDALRHHERTQDFGETFVQLARAVYLTNDRRAALKRHINQLLCSALVEQKCYVKYAG